MYPKVQEHWTFCTFQSTEFSKEYEWEPKITYLVLNRQSAAWAPAIRSSSSYRLQSAISSLLLYVKACFDTRASPLRIYQEAELKVCFPNAFA